MGPGVLAHAENPAVPRGHERGDEGRQREAAAVEEVVTGMPIAALPRQADQHTGVPQEQQQSLHGVGVYCPLPGAFPCPFPFPDVPRLTQRWSSSVVG